MARSDTRKISFCHKRSPLRHAQQKAARRGRIGDSLSRIGVAARETSRCCGLAATGISEKGHRPAGKVLRRPAPVEEHATRYRVSSQILVRVRSERTPEAPCGGALHIR